VEERALQLTVDTENIAMDTCTGVDHLAVECSAPERTHSVPIAEARRALAEEACGRATGAPRRAA
jgi:hypothetical protein